MIQDLGLRAFRDADELRELFVSESAKALRDIARRRSAGVVQLLAKPKSPLEFGSGEIAIGLFLELMCKLPRDDFPEVSESSHAVQEATELPPANR